LILAANGKILFIILIIWISLQFEIRVIRKIADNLAGLYKGVTSKEEAAACIFIKQFITK
jgi:hypothetical protein